MIDSVISSLYLFTVICLQLRAAKAMEAAKALVAQKGPIERDDANAVRKKLSDAAKEKIKKRVTPSLPTGDMLQLSLN